MLPLSLYDGSSKSSVWGLQDEQIQYNATSFEVNHNFLVKVQRTDLDSQYSRRKILLSMLL